MRVAGEGFAMASIITNTFFGGIFAAAIALSTGENAGPDGPYNAQLDELTRAGAAVHSDTVFARADLDASAHLDADEFAALSIVTAELAQLNGFLSIEGNADVAVIPVAAVSIHSSTEKVRLDAVARRKFYLFSGADGLMTMDEFRAWQIAEFEAADFNGNGRLTKKELDRFARRQAGLSTGA